jgi:hypothetical protein
MRKLENAVGIRTTDSWIFDMQCDDPNRPGEFSWNRTRPTYCGSLVNLIKHATECLEQLEYDKNATFDLTLFYNDDEELTIDLRNDGEVMAAILKYS